MAKTKYRKYYRKSRWSANIKQIVNSDIHANGSSAFYGYIPLCTNPAQSDTTVSQQFTVARTQFSFSLDSDQGNDKNLDSATGYIMFVPQGYQISSDIVYQHPDWILSMRFYGKIVDDTESKYIRPLSIRTNMKRRLQTGDKLIFLLTGVNMGLEGYTIHLNGVIRWWTKAA